VPIVAIQPRRLYREVADQLRQLIESGEYGPGTRMPPERDLASQLGISRPTVREALIALEVEGRVKIRMGSGIYVTETAHAVPKILPADGIEGPFELLRAREFIEGAIAAEAAQKARPAEIARIDEILARMHNLSAERDAMIAVDREFHTRIAAMLGNAVLERFVGELFDQRINPFFERLSAYFEDDSTWKLATSEHAAIRDAIAAADPAGAKTAMERHLRASQERFSHNFDDASEREGADDPDQQTGHASGRSS
jgi:DNA-binding FadR family transcriptional regulator